MSRFRSYVPQVLFGGLLELPVPRYSELFYGSILVQLCQLMADHLPQVLAQAVAYVYERLDTMNTVLVDRFGSWFAYFLSNFKYVLAPFSIVAAMVKLAIYLTGDVNCVIFKIYVTMFADIIGRGVSGKNASTLTEPILTTLNPSF